MKSTFHVKNEKVESTKALVRQHATLRFLRNPLQVGTSTEFCLEGDVEDFNSLNVMLEELNVKENKKEKPEPNNFVEHFWSVVKGSPLNRNL
jgi:hypothetical protein